MIINTGQRTDIPAFYSKWLINRIKEGRVLVRNPYYPSCVTEFKINPEVVDCIGFCTKNPLPMLKYMDLLKPYGQFWYITITAFDKDLEPNVPAIDEVIESVKKLSGYVGKNAIGWRYTPIIVNEKYTIDYHMKMFRHVAECLDGYARLAVYGFIDIYPKLLKNEPDLKDTTDEVKILLSEEFQKIARLHHMDLRLCSKEKWLKDYGIDTDGCMRLEDYEMAIGKKLTVKKNMQARSNYCSCLLSNDIGSYSSCLHLCRYCYANGKKETVMKNYQMHSDESPFLIGGAMKNDVIHPARQESWIKKEENNLFDFMEE